MPRFPRPDGRTDLVQTTDHLVAHFKKHGRGRAKVIAAQEIADLYDISVAQARRCAHDARVILRHESEVLCSRPGPGGGWYVADEEEQAREYSIRRAADTLTRIENQARDARAAIQGVAQSAPKTIPFWERTTGYLDSIEGDLRRARSDLQIGAEAAKELVTSGSSTEAQTKE